jgi:general secretion pathway protein K
MVAVALLTAVAVDIAYQARVSIHIAANGRDELRAQALARGSVALGRLVLHFQNQLDEAAGRGQALAGAVTGGPAAASSMPRPQLWKMVPIDSLLVANLFGGGGEDRPKAGGKGGATGQGAPAGHDAGTSPAPARPEGPGPGSVDTDGHFQALLDDEDRKISVQFDSVGETLAAQVASYLALVEERHWDFLFDREDAGGQRTSRTDLMVHLQDWVDADQVQASWTGNPQKPFEPGFGDENFAYDRGPERYKAKNARFDSLDELFLVTGVSDAFMAAFGDRLTVYLDKNAKMNVNASDPQELLRRATVMADPKLQPILSDPTFAERLQKSVRELSMGGFVSITSVQFAQILQAMGLSVNASYRQANVDQKGGFTDRSRVFRVRGVATVGQVEKAVEAVVTFDSAQAPAQAAQLGRLLHWREE